MLIVPAPAPAQAPVVREGAYVTRVGEAPLARERYRFDGAVLTAEVELLTANIRMATETGYDRALSPERFRLTARALDGTAVLQGLEVTFGDSARWRMTAGGAQSGATALVPPYVVMLNLQFSHIALAVLRYDRTAGGRQSFNAWLPQGATVVPLAITLSGDSGTVDAAGVSMQVTLDPTGWLRGAVVPAQGVTVEWRARLEEAARPPRAGSADTTPPPAAVESPLTFPSGALTLEGTLTVPRGATGPMPVAVIVAGSGPTDRDGNSPLGVRSNAYAQLAWRLAERGIATLRYDKRGLGASRGALDPAATTFDDFVDDVIAAARRLAGDGRFSRIVVLGHSEGAGLAVRAATRGAPLAGIGLLAGMGRPFEAVLREQLAAQFDEAALARFDSAFARYLRGEEPGDLPAALRVLVLPVNREFTRTAVGYAPTREIRDVPVPVLIVQGATDFQVTVRDAEALAAARPDARLVVIPEANHLFKRAPDPDRASQAAQYLDPTLPIVASLVDTIADWIATLR